MLTVRHVDKSYRSGGLFSFSKQAQQVLRSISFDWREGECLGIIGESGSGKSTLGRLLLGIEKPDRGTILWDGKRADKRQTRIGRISAVFQDYTSSINPFYTVEQALLEPLRLLHRRERKRDDPDDLDDRGKLERLLHQVGLDSSYLVKYPHELSGGEAQRVCIARAVATEPRCIVLDEAISSLDGSVQVQVLDLLIELREKLQMGYIFITHDIQAAAYICDRLMIVRSGQIEEIIAPAHLKDARSPYTHRLLQAMMT